MWGLPMRVLSSLIMLMFLSAAPAWAQDKALSDFFGEWAGSGLAKEGGATTQNRDTTVTIERAADGFKITWSTMRTQLDDQAASVVKSTTMRFKGTATPNVFHLTDSGDILKGGKSAWATLKGATLKIQIASVEANGDWTVQVYDRSLTAPKKMAASFRRITNGEVVRKAELTLSKVE
jgi:hypothetical protein